MKIFSVPGKIPGIFPGKRGGFSRQVFAWCLDGRIQGEFRGKCRIFKVPL